MSIVVIKPGHKYEVGFVTEKTLLDGTTESLGIISFQDGPVKEVGVNGIQNIDLVNILIDRLEYLQTMHEGKYACNENKEQLDHLRKCKDLDKERTRARQKRNVEGTNEA